MYSGPPPIAGRCARYDKGPWEKPMKSQGRASEPAQAKIGTRRLEEQPEKGKAVETADSPVRHTVRLTTADREVTIPVFLFQFPGVNVGSADGGSGVNIQPKASWGSAIAKHCGHHSSSYTKSKEDMKHCWVDHGSNQVVHDWAKKKSLKQGNAGWKAEKAWLCFTEKGLRKLSFRSGDAGVS
ncbi:unnamed protein product [Lactuca virosa]|uniref:Uncharacterized protein n=1 Tax=Lactuca virosa TaxID=75947 RepID=A0AAU9NFA2_9ASTR|nr:unnamed protein product [Lactuca virosa]